MKNNRRLVRHHSAFAVNAGYVAVFIIVAMSMTLFYQYVFSGCETLSKKIGEGKRRLARLEEERERVAACWEQLKTPEQLEIALLRFGRTMHYAKPAQVVRMGADGRPLPAQYAVAKALQRRGVAAAMATPPAAVKAAARPQRRASARSSARR